MAILGAILACLVLGGAAVVSGVLILGAFDIGPMAINKKLW